MLLRTIASGILCFMAAQPCMASQSSYVKEVRETLPNNDEIRALYSTLFKEWFYRYNIQLGNFDMDGLLLAVKYSAEKHYGQLRKDAAETPYIIHPLQVCHNLWKIGKVRNTNILIAALLHDTLEDTDATPEEIEILFGPRVLETIKELTNDPSLSTDENKQRQIDHAPYMSQDARLIKLADRLANIMDLRSPPPSWSSEKVGSYLTWGTKLCYALAGTNEKLEKALLYEIKAQLNG